jgi:hypothetical protein
MFLRFKLFALFSGAGASTILDNKFSITQPNRIMQSAVSIPNSKIYQTRTSFECNLALLEIEISLIIFNKHPGTFIIFTQYTASIRTGGPK